ncbi:MAG: hypothetical protein JXK05_00520 [Campylobacterales bacterium]|nr:hypothetical protein [Campylobacterales bacterium]
MWRIVAIGLLLGTLWAQGLEEYVISGKPPLEAKEVEAFAQTMKVARAKTQAAMAVLDSGAATPEGSASAEQSLQALRVAFSQGAKALGAEKEACAQTGMDFERFKEIRARLIQVRMYEQLEHNRAVQKEAKTANTMQEEAKAKLEAQLAALEEKVRQSEAKLEQTKTREAEQKVKLEAKITKEQAKIAKLEEEIQAAKTDKIKESKQKQLERANAQIAKLTADRDKPSTAVPAAEQRIASERKKAAQFKEQMPLVLAEMQKSFDEIGDYQQKSAQTMDDLADTPMMQQAKVDQGAFVGYEDLQPFALVP